MSCLAAPRRACVRPPASAAIVATGRALTSIRKSSIDLSFDHGIRSRSLDLPTRAIGIRRLSNSQQPAAARCGGLGLGLPGAPSPNNARGRREPWRQVT